MRRIILFLAIIYILIQTLPDCKAGIEYHERFVGGSKRICGPCRLGRGKCRKKCKTTEVFAGICHQGMLCCRTVIL